MSHPWRHRPRGDVELGADARLNTDMAFFERLFGLGRVACEGWLATHFDALGRESTVDIRAMFEGEIGPMGRR